MLLLLLIAVLTDLVSFVKIDKSSYYCLDFDNRFSKKENFQSVETNVAYDKLRPTQYDFHFDHYTCPYETRLPSSLRINYIHINIFHDNIINSDVYVRQIVCTLKSVLLDKTNTVSFYVLDSHIIDNMDCGRFHAYLGKVKTNDVNLVVSGIPFRCDRSEVVGTFAYFSPFDGEGLVIPCTSNIIDAACYDNITNMMMGVPIRFNINVQMSIESPVAEGTVLIRIKYDNASQTSLQEESLQSALSILFYHVGQKYKESDDVAVDHTMGTSEVADKEESLFNGMNITVVMVLIIGLLGITMVIFVYLYKSNQENKLVKEAHGRFLSCPDEQMFNDNSESDSDTELSTASSVVSSTATTPIQSLRSCLPSASLRSSDSTSLSINSDLKNRSRHFAIKSLED
uniref:ZP domain-containing protein n=1 Tax=Rhabditophanes sp. KR3021 TaxID=114890 RepID=A0AC35UEK9_9BILA